jgi:parallel beta-helix repeat protein
VTIAGIFDRRTMIGGATEAEGNVVAAPNPGAMIMQGHACKYSLIAGNRIGTVSAGTQSPQGLTIGCEHTTIQNNTIANNLASGVAISGFSYNTIRRNSIHSNSGPGISLTKGANGMLAPPRITDISGGVVRGTACPNYEVEIFSDAEDEGRIFEGAVTAEASGTFSFRKASPLIGPNITATATDSQGNTSEFSVPRAVKPAFRKK